MMRSLYIASSGMKAQQMNIDVVANNLANVNTTGFKKSRADFQSLLYENLRSPSVSANGFFNPTGIEVGSGVRVVGTLSEFAQGIPQATGNDLDVCIEGRGFFMVELPNGEVGFSRDGAFRVDGAGYLVNAAGYRVLSSQGNDSGSSVSVDGKSVGYIKPDTENGTIIINADGTIGTEKVEAGSGSAPIIELAVFTNPAALEAAGSSAYTANEVCGDMVLAAPTEEGMGTLMSGFLENSNVQIVDEMVKMIVAQRAYEINSKSIETSDQILSLTNNLKR